MITKKDNQIMVDELRPISEASKDKAILINTTHGGEALYEACYREGLWWIGCVAVEDDLCIVGYTSMPIFQAKKTDLKTGVIND